MSSDNKHGGPGRVLQVSIASLLLGFVCFVGAGCSTDLDSAEDDYTSFGYAMRHLVITRAHLEHSAAALDDGRVGSVDASLEVVRDRLRAADAITFDDSISGKTAEFVDRVFQYESQIANATAREAAAVRAGSSRLKRREASRRRSLQAQVDSELEETDFESLGRGDITLDDIERRTEDLVRALDRRS